MSLQAIIDTVTAQENARSPTRVPPRWTQSDEQFLRDHLGFLTDAEMGAALGRSEVAVHLRWSRDLGLPAPSKDPRFFTAEAIANLLGIDSHKPVAWANAGLLPARIIPNRNIHMVRRDVFLRWAVNPAHWIYFDTRAVLDPHLNRLLELARARWGDEWWTSRQVADHHGISTSDVKRFIKHGRLPAVQPVVSLAGRSPDPYWRNWFIRRSDAFALRFWRQEWGLGNTMIYTRRQDEWMITAHRAGWSYEAIARSMKRLSGLSVANRLRKLGYSTVPRPKDLKGDSDDSTETP